MLACGETLRTWALEREPCVGAVITAMGLPDHRLAYLDYQGPVSGERGTVLRVDSGTYTVQSESPCGLLVKLDGEKQKWHVRLTRHADDAQRWMVAFSTG